MAGVWAAAWVRGGGAWHRWWAACVGRIPPCIGAGAWGQFTGGRVGGRATLCLPAMRGRACVDAWAGAASGAYFRAVLSVAIWGAAQLLRGGRVLYGKVPNNAYSQGSQELSASEGTC